MVWKRDISNHCPVWLIINFSNWGPKRFKVNKNWFNNQDLLLFFEKVWEKLRVVGRSDYVLKEKLRLLKSGFRSWNNGVFGRIDLDIEEWIYKINEVDALLASCRDSQVGEMVVVRSETTSRMWSKLKIKENTLLQKSRFKWDSEGDSNSRYFNSVMKERRQRNFIGSIATNDSNSR